MFKFIYIKKKFSKKKFEPVSSNEYIRLKEDFEIIIDIFEEKHKECLQEFKEIYTYKRRLLLVSGFIIASLLVYLLEKSKIFIAPNIYYFYVVYFLTVVILIHSLIYLSSYLLSVKDQYLYKIRFKSYYKYHYRMISETKSYSTYISRLQINKSLLN